MTVAQITTKLERETLIHETASKIVALINDTAQLAAKLGGTCDDAHEQLIDLITADE